MDDPERHLRELQARLERGGLTDDERLEILVELTELSSELGEQLAALPWWVRMLLRLRRWRRRPRPPRLGRW